MHRYKKGDRVKVWSLQSFHNGGFIDGTEGVVAQDQICASVQVAVVRNFGGTYRLDPSYEVYAKQLEPISPYRTTHDTLAERFQELMNEAKALVPDNRTEAYPSAEPHKKIGIWGLMLRRILPASARAALVACLR